MIIDTDKLFSRLSDPAVWRGLAYIAGAFGLQFSEAQQEDIIAAMLGLVGVIHVFFKDKPKVEPPQPAANWTGAPK